MTPIIDIDTYIASFPEVIQRRLQQVRAVIHAAAPAATETISYGMPTFRLNGNLVHFAAFDRHIGFYPAPSGIAAFEEQLRNFKHAKGSVQFLHTQPLPLDLIAAITTMRVNEQQANNAGGAVTK